MTIYDIDARIAAILNQVDAETGEIPDEAFEELDALTDARENKIDNAACMVLDLLADAKKIREQEIVLAERRKALENRAERIKKYVEYATDGEAFSSPRVKVAYRKSEAVELDSALFWEAPDAAYIRQKDPEPDKTAIKAALKAGAVIPGASLVERMSMTIK